MIIEKFVCGMLSTNVFVLAYEKMAAVIDPAKGSLKKVLDFTQKNNFTIKMILLTHSHWDHIGDVLELKNKTNADVYVHKEDSENLQNPGKDGLFLLHKIKGCKPNFYLKDNQILKLADLEIKVLHTPGHSPGSVCFYLEKEKLLFSGDTFFKNSIGKIDFPNSNKEKMWVSLKKISSLPKDVKVMPGHGPNTFIGQEEWLEDPKSYFG